MNDSLWLLIEKKIKDLTDADLAGDKMEGAIQGMAAALDEAGHNVSKQGGNMLALRWAVEARAAAGRPLLEDFDKAVDALTLEDVENIWQATTKVIGEVSGTWPKIADSDRRDDIRRIVEEKRLALLVAEAKSREGDAGIRYLIGAEVEDDTIVPSLGITAEKLAEVHAAIAAEKAERERVARLLGKLEGKSDEEKIKDLLGNGVADGLIIEMAGVDQGAVDAAKKAMEAELAEKKRLEEEEAARKAAEAAGPAIDDIPADEMLEYIESIREILEFSDVEAEIRTMCEQSSIPNALVDIAVSEPDKLDELEAKAEG